MSDVWVRENIKVVAAENVDPQPNPNAVHYPAGMVVDHIGPLAPPGSEHQFLKTEQTFTAYKGGKTYEMTTKTNQYIDITKGKITIQVNILVP